MPSVKKHRLSLAAPAAFVGGRHRLQIGGRRRGIIHPTAQQIAPVDHVDRGPVLLILVGKVAPDLIIRSLPPQSLEREREQSTRPESLVVIVRAVYHMHLHTRKELPRVLVKRGLEPAGPQATAAHPWRREQTHL